MKLLVIDACVRGDESGTRRFYTRYLESLKDEDIEVSLLDLAKADLKPYTKEEIYFRDSLSSEEKEKHEICAFAREFRDADEILVAAPYWDLSFPSCLKVYLEKVSTVGVTFLATEKGYEGLCKAKKARYFTTAGGIVTAHLGYEYVRTLFKMFGIEETELYTIEGLDLDKNKREQYLTEGINSYFG
ncbi:MAG: NAD(P)H-dependent oxidoreductase [Spirochaetales bacterium]|nr:NAD(P)H-dependent oxidoreductase [Spirochaetales bacterium]